jgi:hypothetical protein
MVPLDDKLIRANLIGRLNNQTRKPKAIIEELHVHNGNAIADVVALYKEAHCFEIKGDSDKIERVIKQGHYYNLSFRKITLVTTIKHLDKAIDILPEFWGIMVAKRKNGKVLLKHIRKTKNNPDFNKSLALLTLWKSEMLNLIEQKNYRTQNKSRKLLAELIALSKKKEELIYNISSTLIDRHYQTTVGM